MADPYIGEVRNFGFNYAPYRWAACNGTIIPIQQNTALFSLMGTSFGGNGTSNFALPNLAARAPGGQGNGAGLTPRDLGEAYGQQAVTLLVTEIPAHNHGGIQVWEGGSGTRTAEPTASSALSNSDFTNVYGTPTVQVAMSPYAISITGNGLPHENRQPALFTNFCIALDGVYPSFP